MQGIQNNQMTSMEDANVIKVGRYSVEERKDRILRYLKKKNQRNFNKTIKVFIFIFFAQTIIIIFFYLIIHCDLLFIIQYACRKTLADRRVRVRGRFARNNELCEEDQTVMKNDDNSHKGKNPYCVDDDVQVTTLLKYVALD